MATHEVETAFIERVGCKPDKSGNVILSVILSMQLTDRAVQYLAKRSGRAVTVLFEDAQGELAIEEPAEVMEAESVEAEAGVG